MIEEQTLIELAQIASPLISAWLVRRPRRVETQSMPVWKWSRIRSRIRRWKRSIAGIKNRKLKCSFQFTIELVQ